MDLWPKQDPGRTKARQGAPLAAAAATLQLRLLQAYAALPDAACFGAEHEALSRLCARAFRPAAAGQPSARCLRLPFSSSFLGLVRTEPARAA